MKRLSDGTPGGGANVGTLVVIGSGFCCRIFWDSPGLPLVRWGFRDDSAQGVQHRRWSLKNTNTSDWTLSSSVGVTGRVGRSAGSHVEFLVVELSELAENCGRLVSVLGHGTRQSLGAGGADGLLVVGDVSNQQGAELRDQLQAQRLPESGRGTRQEVSSAGGFSECDS